MPDAHQDQGPEPRGDDLPLSEYVAARIAEIATSDTVLAQRIEETYPACTNGSSPSNALAASLFLDAFDHSAMTHRNLLEVAGPYFRLPNGVDDRYAHEDIVFTRLNLFGRLVHKCPDMAVRENGRQTWVQWLKDKFGVFVPWPAKVVETAILAGRAGPVGEEMRWYSVAELVELTPPAPLIGDVIAEESLVLMYGQWGAGKTFVALDMALSKATGHNWHGVELTPAPVAYILAEGRGGIAARVQAWHEAHGIPDDTLFRLLPQPVDFLDPAQVTALIASIEAWRDPPKFIVVDTMYRCFGGNENDTADMNAFITNVGRLQRETGATVLVIHHPGHEAHRGRGHSAFPQAVDTIIKVVESEGVITLSCDKQRDGPPFEKRRFRLSPRAGSMTVELAADRPDDLPPNAISALATLNETATWDGASNTEWKAATKLKDRTFQRVAKTLFEGGWVKKSNDGRYLVTEKGEDALGLAT